MFKQFESWVIKISNNCNRSHLWPLNVRVTYKTLFRKKRIHKKPSMLHLIFNDKFKIERFKILHQCTK